MKLTCICIPARVAYQCGSMASLLRGAARLVLAGVVLGVVTLDAHAQEDPAPDAPAPESPPADASEPPPEREPEPEPEPPPALTPPELIEQASPEVPEDVELPERAAVVLRITIGLDGSVTEAEVVESAGETVDAIARDVLRRSRFRPARRRGEPIVARVLYRWVVPRRPSPPPRPTEPTEPVEAASEAEPAPSPAEGETGADAGQPAGDDADDWEDYEDSGMGASARMQRDREGILERSAEAVNVVDVAAQRSRARDLGDILAREQGISLQRAGGLGSGSRFSIAGLTDEQIRFFIDGIPLALLGIDAVANYPVGPVDSIEIFRGVVPVRFGSDALGGAVNLRTGDSDRRSFGVASYQVGSFRTHRTTLTGRRYDPGTGLTVGFRGFFDRTANNYPTDVEVADMMGRLSDATIDRFHNDYQAFNGNVDVGILDRPWAKRLQLQIFGTGSNRDIQHNVVQTVPYGEVREQRRAYGGVMRYEVELGPWSTEVVAAYGWDRIVFDDRGDQVYDWFGEPIIDRRVPGEISGRPIFQNRDGQRFFGRVNNFLDITDEHRLTLSVTADFATFDGNDRLFDSEGLRDPQTAQQDLGKLNSGIEYRWSPGDLPFENSAFFKHYFLNSRSEQVLPGNIFRELDRRDQYVGAGNALRVFLADDWLWAKASYEYALRLPDPLEVFGDGRLIQPNLEILPERSHNANAGIQLDHPGSPAGRFRGEVNAFLRQAENQIVLLGNDQFFSFQNVNVARSIGVEAAVGWISPGDWVSATGNVTYLDFRNASDQGAFGDFEGDRIPNRPYLQANANASFNVADLAGLQDELRVGGDVRFVEEFFRSWESQGDRRFKQTVDRQTSYGVFASYVCCLYDFLLTINFLILNLTNSTLFDGFGVQNPPRTFFLMVTGQFQPPAEQAPPVPLR